MKVVINKCFGGFGLSAEAVIQLHHRGSKLVKVVHEDASEAMKKDKLIESLIYFGSYIPHGHRLLSYEGGYCHETRADADLVAVVEALGERANGRFAKLAVVEIPDGIDWEIDKYDGSEKVVEAHRSWS